VHYDDETYLSEKDLPPRVTPPDLVHHLFTGVMHYLADHMSVTMECSMDIMNKPAVLGFNQLPNEQNTLTIPYNLTGYAVSWKKIGPVLRNRPNCGGRIACVFTPGTQRPLSVGPAYFWVHLDKPLKHKVSTPPQRQAPNNPLMVVYSTPEDTNPLLLGGGENRTVLRNTSKLRTNGAAFFHPLRDYPAMWGQNCEKKRINQKCNQTLVDIETKIRYDESFYDPYQNRSLLPDFTQEAVFFPPEHTRETRQVFAATIAIVTAFAVQWAVDYAGYEGIQGVEQELNDEMNTRAKANNKRFRQADNAIGKLSRQIQDLNAKVEELSEEDAATVQLLLRTIKTQALENEILQSQIGENNRALVEMSKAHLQTATADRKQSDAQTYLFKTIVSALVKSKPFLQQGIGYTWKLHKGLMHLQGVEKQLVNLRGAEKQINYDIIINETCSGWQAEENQSDMQEAERTLEKDVQKHLEETRNLSRKINITRPKPIVVHYVPEITNLSLHESGERMKEAFEKVIKHPLDAVEDAGNVVTGFFENWLKNPLKIVLTVGAIIILVIILAAILKRGYKVYQEKRQPQVVGIKMIQKLTKPYLLK